MFGLVHQAIILSMMSDRYDKVMKFLVEAEIMVTEMSKQISKESFERDYCLRKCKRQPRQGKLLCDPCFDFLSLKTDVDPISEEEHQQPYPLNELGEPLRSNGMATSYGVTYWLPPDDDDDDPLYGAY